MRRSITAFAVLAAAVVMLALGGTAAGAAQSHRAPASPDAKAAGVRTGAFSLQVRGTKLCARPTGIGEGSAVVLEKCNFVDGNKHLQWWWVENGNRFHNVAAVARDPHSGFLDYDNSAGQGNGRKVQLWGYLFPADNQFWYLERNKQKGDLKAGTGLIRSKWDDRCLDADASSPLREGTKVHMWQCNGGANQVWDVLP